MSKSGDGERSRTRDKGAICFETAAHEGRQRVRLASNIDPSYSDSITVSEPDGRSYSDTLPSLPLPGTGEREETCGHELPLLFCPDCGAPEEVERSCRRSRCPHSWESWDFHRAKSIAAKTAAQDAYRSSFETSYKHHLTVSVANIDIRFNSSDPLARGYEAVKRLMDEVNVSSGYVFYHPYRIASEYRGEVRGHDSGDGDMTWADIIEKITGDKWSWAAIKDEFLSYEPHFHVVCTSDFVQGGAVTRDIEEKTGVIIKRITKPHPDPDQSGKVSIYGEEDLCSVVAYCLSHCGLEYLESSDQWRAAYRPFGEVANRTPSDGIDALVDETMRDISMDVLGVDFQKSTCDEEIIDEDEIESGEGGDDAPASVVDDEEDLDEPSRSPRSPGRRQLATSKSSALPDRSEWDVPDTAPDFVAEVPERAIERCGSDLRPIHQAHQFTGDEEYADWRAEVSDTRLDDLRRALDVLRIELPEALSEQIGPPEPPPIPDG